MLKKLCVILVAALATACSNLAPNDAPVQATNSLQYGGIKATGNIAYGAAPVRSGNAFAIPAGQPGDGGSAAQ